MDVTLTDDQELLRETASRLADDLATPGADAVETGAKAPWLPLVELGVPALRSPEHSGIDASGVEAALVVEEFGRTLSTAPVVGQALVVPELLTAAGATELLDRVVAGDVRLAPMLRRDCAGLGELGDDLVAFDAAGATHGLAVDRSGRERRLVAVALPDAPLDGLDLTRTLVAVDAGAAAVEIGDLGTSIAPGRWAMVMALGLTMVAADLVGIMRGALDDVVGYVAERRQFGVPVGTFQAVQHLAADALVLLEGARSCCWYAAWAIDHRDPATALLAARTAKGYTSKAGLAVVEVTVQLFGGIAITWEQMSHLRLRRTLFDRQIWGDETVQYDEVARLRLANPELV
ncbi:MAG TPA: acyl-CoA dehydrogenase family protein [Acidimicrobiia bacterium]|jgi:alkylation response protein AidB-like acyl-CoA dehydrogenase